MALLMKGVRRESETEAYAEVLFKGRGKPVCWTLFNIYMEVNVLVRRAIQKFTASGLKSTMIYIEYTKGEVRSTSLIVAHSL